MYKVKKIDVENIIGIENIHSFLLALINSYILVDFLGKYLEILYKVPFISES